MLVSYFVHRNLIAAPHIPKLDLVYYRYMFVLTKMLINQSVMSLRTGSQIATAVEPIINPNNLKIEGFYCLDSREKHGPLVLLHRDIRDVLPAGLVVDDYEVLAEPEDLIRLKKVMGYHFELIGKPVYTENKKKLGKVTDYATEPQSMMIQKLYAVQSIFTNFSGGSLSIDRNQIIEVTHDKIIVKELLQPIKSGAPSFEPNPAG